MYVYAAMKTFLKHDFIARNDSVNPEIYANWTDEQKCRYPKIIPCDICSAYRQREKEKDYDDFYFVGGVSADIIYDRLYVLRRINRLEHSPSVTEHDFNIFREIIACLKSAEPEAKIGDIQKQLKKASFFKPLVNQMKVDGIGIEAGVTLSASEKIRFILDTLGVCGVLHTKKHKGPFYEYTNLAVAPRSSRSSDWAYPVDFWRGSDGIDWEAFGYWFGDYEKF